MKKSVHLGTVRGVAIDVDWSVVVIAALVTWSLAAQLRADQPSDDAGAIAWVVAGIGALALLGSVLVHELAHALMAKRFGVKVEGITLWMFGGVSRFSRHAPHARAELWIAIVGPAASAGVAAVAAVVAGCVALLNGPWIVLAMLEWLALINVVLAIFNLLPGAPLDGGRVLAAVLWRRSGDEHLARAQAARVGVVLGQVLIVFGIIEAAFVGIGGIWLVLIGWFLTASARSEANSEYIADALGGIRVGDVMSTPVQTAAARSTLDEFVRDHAMSSPFSSFPVVSDDGALIGLITLRQVRAVPRREWPIRTLAQVAVPLPGLTLVTAGQRLVDALATDTTSDRTPSAEGRMLVLDGGRLVGIVTPTDINRALQRADLARMTESRS